MSYLLYPRIISLLAIVLYLGDCCKKQQPKNPSTLGLMIGFFAFALASIVDFLDYANLLAWDGRTFGFVKHLCLLSGSVSILWSVLRLTVERSFLLKTFLPILIFLFGFFGGFWAIFFWNNLFLAAMVGVFVIYIPIYLTLGTLFLLLYSRLAFIRESFHNHLGPLLLALGWFIEAVLFGPLPFIPEGPAKAIYFLVTVIPCLLWLIGLILLEKEAQRVFELHLKIHGLRRQKRTTESTPS
jgi:hypothetical protein